MKNSAFIKAKYSNIALSLFFAAVALLLLTSYLPGSDEYLQVQATLNFKSGTGYTMLQHLHTLGSSCQVNCRPSNVFLSAYPPGLSIAALPLTYLFNPIISVALLKITSIVIAYLSWRNLLLNHLFEEENSVNIRLITASFLTLIAFQSTTDVLLAAYIPFAFAAYKNLCNQRVNTREIVIFNCATALALMMKYQSFFIAFPFYLLITYSLISRRDFRHFFEFILAASIPLITTGSYLLVTYLEVGHISTQMISSTDSYAAVMKSITYLSLSDLFTYLNTLLFESFLLTKYIEKILIFFQLSDSVIIILKAFYFIVILGLIIYSVKILLRNGNSRFVKFTIFTIFVNSLFLFILRILFMPDTPDFNQFTYYRYYTFTALLILVTIMTGLRGNLSGFSTFLAYSFVGYTILFVSMKTVESKKIFSTNLVIEESIARNHNFDNENLTMIFSGNRLWRTAWSSHNTYRYITRDFSDLPAYLESNITIMLICTKENTGMLGQRKSDGCVKIQDHERQFKKILSGFRKLETNEAVILIGTT